MGSPIANPKVRRHQQIGAACLVLGLLPQVFGITWGLPPIPLHFLTGLCLGISIAANLAAVRRRRLPRLS